MTDFELSFHAIPFFFVSFVLLGIGLIVFLQRHQSVQPALNKTFFAFCIAIAIWLIWAGIAMSDFSHYWASLACRAVYLGVSFIPVTMYHYTVVWLGFASKQKKWILLGYFLAAFFTFIIFNTNWIIYGYSVYSWGYYSRMTIPGGIVYLSFFTSYMMAMFINLVIGLKKAETPLLKKQIKIILVAFIITYFGTIDFVPCFGIEIPLIGAYPIVFLVGAFLLTMHRYGLFDASKIAAAFQKEKLAAIGVLSTSINHEIRNPLYVIQVLAQSHLNNLKEGVYQNDKEALEKATRMFEKIEKQSTRAMDIMKRFSSFAKQGMDDSVNRSEEDVTSAFDNVIPLIRHEFEMDKIELRLMISESLPKIKIDRRHLEEIIFNLIMNSCQAMKESGGFLEVKAKQGSECLEISFEDNGPGIHPDKLKQIFEPFFSTKEEGTGLGLYITKQLVERNGGKLTVESSLEKGTCFTLEFPI